MSCIPCTQIGDKYRDVIRYYKMLFEQKGVVTWVYKLSYEQDWHIISGKQFKLTYDELIQPDLKNGAEYFMMEEFKGL